MKKLESSFYVVANIGPSASEKKDNADAGLNKKIVKGYERVLRARLEDAFILL